jgi:hypothetical protein
MNGILPLIIVVGLGLYLLLSHKAAMGSCGRHHGWRTAQTDQRYSRGDFPDQAKDMIIDLRKDDYKVISIEKIGR